MHPIATLRSLFAAPRRGVVTALMIAVVIAGIVSMHSMSGPPSAHASPAGIVVAHGASPSPTLPTHGISTPEMATQVTHAQATPAHPVTSATHVDAADCHTECGSHGAHDMATAMCLMVLVVKLGLLDLRGEVGDLGVDAVLGEDQVGHLDGLLVSFGPEIEQLTTWLDEWGAPDPDSMGMDHGPMDGGSTDGMMTDDDIQALEDAEGAEAGRLFLEQMIVHHEGAIEMAQTEVDDGDHEGAVEMAGNIVSSQTSEIQTMEGLLAGE